MKLGIAGKFLLLSILTVALTSIAIGTAMYIHSRDILHQQARRDLQEAAQRKRDWILAQFAQLREDVLYLVGTEEVQGVVRE